MPDHDDPFGAFDDATGARTVIKPVPGGAVGSLKGSPREPGGPIQDTRKPVGQAPQGPVAWPLPADGGLNPVERAASPLLVLLGKLFHAADHPDPVGLRQRVEKEIRVFENNARVAGVGPEDVFVARYVLCTAIDEAVLNTPWGARSGWDRQSLLATFHKEAAGGARFFQLLHQMSRDPGGNLDVLELMYLCLTLGFQGKYRLSDGGLNRLEEVKHQLYRTLRQQRGEYERSLAPRWRGVAQVTGALGGFIPLWVVGVVAGAILLLVYSAFSFKLSGDSAPASERITAIEDNIKLPQRIMTAPPVLPRPVRSRPEPPPKPTPVGLAELLGSDISAGLVAVDETALRSKIVVRGEGLFRSGRAQVGPAYLQLFERIAVALEKLRGDVIVAGHTDSIPIRTLRFPSNWHLSQARARAVVKILAEHTGSPERYTAEGRGDKEPVAPNDTKANRALNRRVEIVLLRPSDKA